MYIPDNCVLGALLLTAHLKVTPRPSLQEVRVSLHVGDDGFVCHGMQGGAAPSTGGTAVGGGGGGTGVGV